jgi:S-adenosylmethionine/arginine decarboxylase-like enzyme
MVPLEQVGHDFPGEGYSLCVILAESHLALHTYPERSRSVVVELSVCDHLRPNRERAFRLAERLVEIFQPARYVLEPGSMRPVGEERVGPATAAHDNDD